MIFYGISTVIREVEAQVFSDHNLRVVDDGPLC